jgi:hypothetical protein
MVTVSKNVLNRSNYSISIHTSDIITQFRIDRYPHTYQKYMYYMTHPFHLRLRDMSSPTDDADTMIMMMMTTTMLMI